MIIKKYLPLLLLVVIFMPVLISATLFIWQQVIHFEMMEALEAENLTTIVIKKHNLQWTRAGKEINVQGKLFDVDNISYSGDSCIVKGLFDEKESVLVETIEKNLQQSPYNKPLHLLLSKAFSHFLFIDNKTTAATAIMRSLSEKYCSFIQAGFNSYQSSPAGPPPKYYC